MFNLKGSTDIETIAWTNESTPGITSDLVMVLQWTFTVKNIKWRKMIWTWNIARFLKTSIDEKIILHWLLKHESGVDWIRVAPEKMLWAVLVSSLVNHKNCVISWLGEISIWVVKPVRSFSDVEFQHIPEITVSVPYF